MNLIEVFHIKELLYIAFITSAVVSVFHSFFAPKFFAAKWRKKLLLIIVAFAVTFTLTEASSVKALAGNMIANVSVAILFYSYFGGKFIALFFLWPKNHLTKLLEVKDEEA